jgi:hypothetical protein
MKLQTFLQELLEGAGVDVSECMHGSERRRINIIPIPTATPHNPNKSFRLKTSM